MMMLELCGDWDGPRVVVCSQCQRHRIEHISGSEKGKE